MRYVRVVDVYFNIFARYFKLATILFEDIIVDWLFKIVFIIGNQNLWMISKFNILKMAVYISRTAFVLGHSPYIEILRIHVLYVLPPIFSFHVCRVGYFVFYRWFVFLIFLEFFISFFNRRNWIRWLQNWHQKPQYLQVL